MFYQGILSLPTPAPEQIFMLGDESMIPEEDEETPHTLTAESALDGGLIDTGPSVILDIINNPSIKPYKYLFVSLSLILSMSLSFSMSQYLSQCLCLCPFSFFLIFFADVCVLFCCIITQRLLTCLLPPPSYLTLILLWCFPLKGCSLKAIAGARI